MNIQPSGTDIPHLLYPCGRTGSKDLYDIAVNYTLHQYALNNTMCSKYQTSPHSDVPFYSDTLPLHYHADNDYMRRMQVRDNTSPLKLWLLQHKKNPYPSKPEKIMLAILARMTLTQVSTWFANARRRLKRDYPDVEYIGAENGTYCGTDIHVM